MRLVDRNTIGTYVVAVACLSLIAMIVLQLMKAAINKVSNYRFRRENFEKFANMRTTPPPPSGVTQTDIITNMTKVDRDLHDQAMDLIVSGHVLQGAKILESIRFQRTAIDFLERAGLIDEACAMLIRLNATSRAAAVYERNFMLEKAAHLYASAEQHEHAGRVFLKMAVKDHSMFRQAGEAYERASKFEAAISAYASLLDSAKVVELAYKHAHHSALFSYIREPRLAREVFANLTPEQILALGKSVALTPQNVATLASWCEGLIPDATFRQLLEHFAKASAINQVFWQHMSPQTRKKGLTLLQANNSDITVLTAHAKALEQGKLTVEAAQLYDQIGDAGGVARCRAA